MRILAIDSDRKALYELASALRALGHEVVAAAGAEAAASYAAATTPQLVFADVSTPGAGGFRLVDGLAPSLPDAAWVLLTDKFAFTAPTQLPSGLVCDVIRKPPEPGLLATLLARAAAELADPLPPLVGASMQMEAVRRRIDLVAGSGAPVHISGEAGTGKTLVARHVVRRSARRLRPVEIVHAAELDVQGLVDALTRLEFGTLVIERLGDLSDQTADALVDLVERGRVHRPRTGSLVEPDVRLVTTSHRRLDALVALGAIHRCLYGRLESASIELTPLRGRPEDIRGQAAAILREVAAARGVPELEVDDAVWERLASLPLATNSHGLRDLLVDAAAAAGRGRLRLAHLPDRPGPRIPTGDQTLEGLLARDEAAHIVGALQVTDNVSEAAARLGVSVATLYRKMKKLGIRP